jgi:hypothetical protein
MLFNLACETCVVTGTTATLAGAYPGYNTLLAAGVTNGVTIRYALQDYDPATNKPISSEGGTAVYTSATNTLALTVTDSTNGNAPIVITKSARIYVTPLDDDFLTLGSGATNAAAGNHSHSAVAETDPVWVAFRDTARAAGTFWGGPASGAAAAPTFRAIQATDIPALAYLSDAASDGFAYGRLNAAWAKVGGLALANTWTTTQTITPATDVVGLIINKSTTADALQVKSGATVYSYIDKLGRLFSNLGRIDKTSLFIGNAGRDDVLFTGTRNLIISASEPAGTRITSGSYNTGLGTYVFILLTSGIGNLALGANVLSCLKTGNNNIGIGVNAISTGATVADYSDDIGIGRNALFACYGSKNTALGSYAGVETTSGSSLIFLGYYAGSRQTTLSNLLIIDNQQRASAAVELTNSILYGVMAATPGAQTLRINAVTSIILDSATTNATIPVQYLQANSTGTPADGFGAHTIYVAESATADAAKNLAYFAGQFKTATAATFLGKAVIGAYDYNSPTTPRVGIEVEADGSAVRIGFFGVTPAVRQTELTDELTTITCSAPGTPDYAIADPTQVTPFGYTTSDEMLSTLNVIANLQTRVNELETKLTAYGLLVDAD